MKNGWAPGEPLNEVWSHLHCAVIQSLPSDDQIIMDHVRAAYTLMGAEMQKAIKEEVTGMNMRDKLDRLAHGGETLEDPDPPRDFFAEAFCIADGGCCLLAQREHIVAVLEHFRAQAAGVADPVTREELRESWDEIEPGCGHGLGWPDVTKE